MSVLSRGLKFVPLKPSVNKYSLRHHLRLPTLLLLFLSPPPPPPPPLYEMEGSVCLGHAPKPDDDIFH